MQGKKTHTGIAGLAACALLAYASAKTGTDLTGYDAELALVLGGAFQALAHYGRKKARVTVVDNR